MLPVA